MAMIGNPKLQPGAVAPPGLESRILRQIPLAALGGSLAPLLYLAWAHLSLPGANPFEAVRHLHEVEIRVVSFLILHWTVLLTVALACVIVAVMKGPVRHADSYPVADRDSPSEE